MTNIFLLDYSSRLRLWHDMRNSISCQNLDEICVSVDRFWQQAPLLNHYLHPDEIEQWPSPWELISDNHYCHYARALGIIYTLMLLGVKDIDFVDAIDDNKENVVLVLVDNAKYVLNYYPNSVLNTSLSSFTIVKRINISSLKKKIGEE